MLLNIVTGFKELVQVMFLTVLVAEVEIVLQLIIAMNISRYRINQGQLYREIFVDCSLLQGQTIIFPPRRPQIKFHKP